MAGAIVRREGTRGHPLDETSWACAGAETEADETSGG